MLRRPLSLVALILVLVAGPWARAAEEPGLDDLNRATELRVTASSPRELQEVVELVESAKEKGLEEANQQYANQLLASTLLERAEKLIAPLLEGEQIPADPQRLQREAVQDLEKLLKLNPEFPDAQLLYAKLQVLGGEREKALAAVDKAVEQLKKQNDRGANRTLVEALILRAQLKEDFEGIVGELNQALELDPDNLEARLLRAQLYLAHGDLEKARQDVEKLLESEPNLAEINLMAMLIAEQQKRSEDAIRYIRRLLRLDPSNVELRLHLALNYGEMQHFRTAFDILDGVLKDDPNNWTAMRTRADLMLNMGRHKEAIAQYEKVLKLQPDDEGVLNNLAWVLATSPEDELRDGKRAVELATKAAEQTNHEAAYILSTLAAAYAETGDFESARKWASKAVEVGAKEEDEELNAQLKKEAESYEQNKPWREKFEMEDKTPAEGQEESTP